MKKRFRHTTVSLIGLIGLALSLAMLADCRNIGDTAKERLAAKPPNPARFVKQSDWGVLDTETGLIWERKTDANFQRTMNWEEARLYARALTLGGYSDWRLPKPRELKKLFDSRYVPTVSPQIFKHTLAWCWTSKKMAFSKEAYYADFTTGLISPAHQSTAFYVRAVRDSRKNQDN